MCLCVLLYDAEISAFIPGEAYVVLLFEFFIVFLSVSSIFDHFFWGCSDLRGVGVYDEFSAACF